MGKTSALLDPTPTSSTVTAGGEDILGEVPADRPLSYKLERKEGGGVGSSHPDAVRRRLRSERRKEKRRMIYDAGLEWWQVVKDCSSNIHIAECSDEYYYALRLARAAGRDAVVQYFSPRCGACKEESVHCAQVAFENPGLDFIRVRADTCMAVIESHGITKVPWVQYLKAGDLSPVKEGLRLSSLEDIVHIPANLGQGLVAAEGQEQHCVLECSIDEIEGFETLLQAINL